MIGNSLSVVGKAKIAECYFRPLCPECPRYTTTNVKVKSSPVSTMPRSVPQGPLSPATRDVHFYLGCPQGFPISEAKPAHLLEGNFKIFSSSFSWSLSTF